MNAQAHCAEPYYSPIDVRGAQNVPQPGGGHGDPAVGSGGDASAARRGHPLTGSATGTTPLPTVPLPLSSLAQILLP